MALSVGITPTTRDHPTLSTGPDLLVRVFLLLAGIVLGQAVLYGPSLIGRKVLLPLDILAMPKVYLPQTAEFARIEERNRFLGDMIYVFEPARRFATDELRTGRLPSWIPYQYAGSPFTWPKFSPFLALECLTKSPIILAWSQMFVALVAGIGAYLFFRGALGVRFWSALIPAWCYPLTGFFVFWQGFPSGLPVCWLPWCLLLVDRVVRRTSRLAPVAIAILTGLVLVSGSLDISGQVLLASGLFAIWVWFDEYGEKSRRWMSIKAGFILVSAWVLGFLLAAPAILPIVEYTQTGARMARRSAGAEERPPVGLAALPQVVLPDIYGSMETGSARVLAGDNQAESTAAAYTGAIATLFAAPLAWCSRRHRRMNWFWAALIFFSLSWSLNIPGSVQVLRLPGLNMLSHNRFVFAASFAILALSAVGLDVLTKGLLTWRRSFLMPYSILTALVVWCAYRTLFLPEPLDTQMAAAVMQGAQFEWIHDLNGVHRAQSWFVRHYAMGALWCGTALVGWIIVVLRPRWQSRLLPALGPLLCGDLLVFASGRSVQSDPALYYPPTPALQEVAQSEPGRILGFSCLPASLASICGLRDIRGYDAVDPARLMDLLNLAADPRSPLNPYALSQWYTPRVEFTTNGAIKLSPVLDMLNVRYVIFRNPLAPEVPVAFQGGDYWVVTNSNALPRVYVPRRVEVIADDKARLEKLASPEFNPRETGIVELSPGFRQEDGAANSQNSAFATNQAKILPLPEGEGRGEGEFGAHLPRSTAPRFLELPTECRGTAKIVDEIPTRVSVSVNMETPGLLILSDLWDKGWHAYMDQIEVPILRANHAVRGVLVPAGSRTIEFKYQPASFALGLRLAGAAGAVLLAWLGVALRRQRGFSLSLRERAGVRGDGDFTRTVPVEGEGRE